jgi:hypothetical protein
MQSRADRRHHMQRLKQRVADYYIGHARDDARARGRLAKTRTPCSCWMCGNPRRHLGERTLQERRLLAAAE